MNQRETDNAVSAPRSSVPASAAVQSDTRHYVDDLMHQVQEAGNENEASQEGQTEITRIQNAQPRAIHEVKESLQPESRNESNMHMGEHGEVPATDSFTIRRKSEENKASQRLKSAKHAGTKSQAQFSKSKHQEEESSSVPFTAQPIDTKNNKIGIETSVTPSGIQASINETNQTKTADLMVSPIRQNAESLSDASPLKLGEGVEESDVVFGENIDKIIDKAEKELALKASLEMVSVPEVDVEESQPNMALNFPSPQKNLEAAEQALAQSNADGATIDMNNFSLLSDRQRAEQNGEEVDLTSSVQNTQEQQNRQKVDMIKKESPNRLPFASKFGFAAPGAPMNEEAIFNRIPETYFAHDEEQSDLNIAMADIKAMREGFINDFTASGMSEHLQEMTDILQPAKFIERHFGNEPALADGNAPDFLFNDVIKEVPAAIPRPKKIKNKRDSQGSALSKRSGSAKQRSPQKPIPDNQATLEKNIQKIDQTLENTEKKRAKDPNEDIGISPDRAQVMANKRAMQLKKETFELENISQEGSIEPVVQRFDMWDVKTNEVDEPKAPLQVFHEGSPTHNQRQIDLAINNSRMSADNPYDNQAANQMRTSFNQSDRTKPAVRTQRSKSQNRSGSRISDNRVPIKKIKMAQYFSAGNTNDSRGEPSCNDDITSYRNQDVTNVAHTIESGGHGALSPDSVLAVSGQAEYVKAQTPAPVVPARQSSAERIAARAELERKLEQDILDNVNINFVFNKGQRLAEGLLDPDRIFNIMSKLKEIALRQIENGSKEINYQEIVEYVKSKESVFHEEFSPPKDQTNDSVIDEEVQAKILSREPAQIIVNDQGERERRWTQCIGFLRNNPKLLIQMIPSELDEVMGMKQKPTKKGRAREKMEAAKKWDDSAKDKRDSRLRTQPTAQTGLGTITSQLSEPAKRKPYQSGVALGRISHNNTAIAYGRDEVTNTIEAAVLADSDSARGDRTQPEKATKRDLIRNSNHPLNQILKKKKSRQFRITDQLIKDADDDASQTYARRTKARSGLLSPQGGQMMSRATSDAFNNSRGMALSATNKYITGTTPVNIKLSHEFRKSGLGQLTIDQINDGSRKRPTTAATTHQGPNPRLAKSGTNRGLASNGILKNNMLSRSTVRQNTFNTNVAEAKLMATRDSQGCSSAERSPSSVVRKQPRLPQNFKNHSRFIKKDNQGQPQTFNKRHFGKMHGAANAATLPNSLPSARLNDSTVNVTAGELQFYPQANDQETKNKPSKSPKRLLNKATRSNAPLPPRKQSIKSKAGKGSNTNNMRSSQGSAINPDKIDNSILGEDMSDLNRSVAEHGNNAAAVFEAQKLSGLGQMYVEPKDYIIKTARSSDSDGRADSGVHKVLTDKAMNDSLRVPMIQQRALSPFRVEDQSQQLDNSQIEVLLQSQDRHKAAAEIGLNKAALEDLTANDMSFIDWAYTPLCIKALKKETDFNPEKDIKLFVESEVDYVVDMMRSKFQDFERTEIMRPFYLKALSTLRCLLLEQHMDQRFKQLQKNYREITIENTLKLLLRCKLCFHARTQLLNIFELTLIYELTANDMKEILDRQKSYKVKMDRFNYIRDSVAKVAESGQRVLQAINAFRSDKKSQYKQRFVFKRKDLVKCVKSEIAESKKLVQIFRPKRVDESEDSDEPIRMRTNEHVPQEGEEFEDSQDEYEKKHRQITQVVTTELQEPKKPGYDSGASVIDPEFE